MTILFISRTWQTVITGTLATEKGGILMSIRSNCPCDVDGVCPYDAEYFGSCEYWCGADEPTDDPEDWDDY